MIKYLLALVFLTQSLYGTTYYVDYVSGDDANNGTATGTPWQHTPWDSRATGTADAATLSAGDGLFFNRGVVYESGTGQTGTLHMIDDAGNPANPIVIGAYGSGNKPIICGGIQLDESQFALYSGSVYRATNSSLGLTGIDLETIFEADKWDVFNPYAEPYTEQASTSLDVCDFYQSGTASGDYVYIRTSTSGTPVGMDLYADWMDSGFRSSQTAGYVFENIAIYGFDVYSIETSGTPAGSAGYSVVVDSCHLGWGYQATQTGSTKYGGPIWIKNSSMHYMFRNSNGGYIRSYTSDRASLIEDSEFIRYENVSIFYGSSSYTVTIRRNFFMDLPYYPEVGFDVAEHTIRIGSAGVPVDIYRNVFYNVSNDIVFDNAIEWGHINFWNNTVHEDRSARTTTSIIDPNYTDEYTLNFRNNAITYKIVLYSASAYGVYTNVEYTSLVMRNNCYIANLSARPHRFMRVYASGATVVSDFRYLTDTQGSPDWEDFLVSESAPANGREESSMQVNVNTLSDIYISTTYGNTDFLKPKVGSVLINAGLTIADGENELDYSGNAMVGSYDLGAYEYSDVSLLPPDAPKNLKLENVPE